MNPRRSNKGGPRRGGSSILCALESVEAGRNRWGHDGKRLRGCAETAVTVEAVTASVRYTGTSIEFRRLAIKRRPATVPGLSCEGTGPATRACTKSCSCHCLILSSATGGSKDAR